MKRLVLLALLGLFLLPDHAHAQRRKRQPPVRMGATFGVKLGAAYSNVVGYQAPVGDSIAARTVTYEGKFGIMGGVLANYRFTQQLSMQGEVLYVPRGTTTTTGTGQKQRSFEYKMTYVDIPVMAKFNAKIFFVQAGLVPALLVDSKRTDPLNNSSAEIAGLKKLDIGYCFGVGVELIQGGFFGVRYVRSSSSIGAGGPLVGSQALENQSFQITGGYIFNHSAGRRRR